MPGCRNVGFGPPRASTCAEDSKFSRTQVSPLPFLLYASELKVLHSPPVLPGIPVRFILAPMLWRWLGHNETRGEQHLSFHEAPELHWRCGGCRSRAESRFWPFIKWTAIAKLFLFGNGLQGMHIYGALLLKVHACNSHLANVLNVGMLRGGETN